MPPTDSMEKPPTVERMGRPIAVFSNSYRRIETFADAYQGQRRLGNIGIAASQCHILTDPAHPNVCDANHADDVTAQASWLS